VARIRELVGAVEGLEVAGAAYDGVGVPACIGSGRAAAAATLTHLRSGAGAGRE
jgi:protoporphyrinogen/coproporphyrinogen III oxidase